MIGPPCHFCQIQFCYFGQFPTPGGRDRVGPLTMASSIRQRSDSLRLKENLVERAEAYLRAHVGVPVPLSRVSRHVGLSERGLRNAFYGVHGMSPTRYIRAERLERARRALSDRSTGRPTVTGVATE